MRSAKFRVEIIDTLDTDLNGTAIASNFSGAQTAAEAGIDLMAFVQSHLAPRIIIDEYVAAKQTSNTNDALWAAVGVRTMDCLTQGILYLAEIWESAWLEGGGPNIGMVHLEKQSEARLRQHYKAKSFVPSNFLHEY